jgi:integrase
MSPRGSKHVLPSHLTTSDDADYSRLIVPAGPWTEDIWTIVPHAGDHRRNVTAPCQATDCTSPPFRRGGMSKSLCYAHYFQWRRDGQPADIAAWARSSARPPQKRTRHPRPPRSRGIDFRELPTRVALEIRSVVGTKITQGDWTANLHLHSALECLVKAVHLTGAQSLLDRRPEDWVLLARQVTTVGDHNFTDIRSYLTTFFATLHRALIIDPWAEDAWLWRGSFDRLLATRDGGGDPHNVNWHKVQVSWLREPAKQLAKRSLITGQRSWGTMDGWVRGLTRLSNYLEQEGIDRPELLDRDLFLEYLSWVRETSGSKNSLQLVNTVAVILETLRADDLLPELPVAVYLRRGENAVEKVRQPRPYPADVIELVDRKIISDPDGDPELRTMLRFNRWGGLRISELVALPLDCLRHNGKGGYWIEYWMPKTKSWRRFPVPADLAADLLAQQDRVRSLYGEARYMFPSPKRSNAEAKIALPWSTAGFRRRVTRLFAQHGITHSQLTGERISGGEIHRYRHTVGTTLLNSDWSQREVQDFLGHASPTMTAAYAEVLDETLTRKADKFHRDQTDQNAGLSGQAEDAKVERLRSRFVTALPNGFCMLPASKACDFRPTPCLGCAFFDPGGSEFSAVHANQRKQLRLLIEQNTDTAAAAINQQVLEAVSQIAPATDEVSA